jgi:hypothetical protein
VESASVEKAGKPIRFGNKVLANLSLRTLRPMAIRLAESNKALIARSVSGNELGVGLPPKPNWWSWTKCK